MLLATSQMPFAYQRSPSPKALTWRASIILICYENAHMNSKKEGSQCDSMTRRALSAGPYHHNDAALPSGRGVELPGQPQHCGDGEVVCRLVEEEEVRGGE